MANIKRRASLRDVAEMAGVSLATVDRVLNGRGKVKGETVAKVREVAEQLGFEKGVYREDFLFNILLQDPEHYYYRDLGRAIEAEAEALQKDGLRVAIHYLGDTDDAAVARKITELAADADGIAGVFVQNTRAAEAIATVIDQGKPVVTLLSDIRHPRRAEYVGLDNRTVGRTAGYLLGRLVKKPKGRILVTAETMNYLGLEEREMGLRALLLEKFPNLHMSSVVEKGGNRDTMVQRVAERLADPEVVGIYNAGGRNSVIAEAISLAGRTDLVFIGSELTEVSRRLLIEERLDAVISFPARRAGRAIAHALLEATGRGSVEMDAYQPLQIYFVENAILGE